MVGGQKYDTVRGVLGQYLEIKLKNIFEDPDKDELSYGVTYTVSVEGTSATRELDSTGNFWLNF